MTGGPSCDRWPCLLHHPLWSVVLPAAPSPVVGSSACCTFTCGRWPCLLHHYP